MPCDLEERTRKKVGRGVVRFGLSWGGTYNGGGGQRERANIPAGEAEGSTTYFSYSSPISFKLVSACSITLVTPALCRAVPVFHRAATALPCVCCVTIQNKNKWFHTRACVEVMQCLKANKRHCTDPLWFTRKYSKFQPTAPLHSYPLSQLCSHPKG